MFKYFNWGTGQPVDKRHHDCFKMKSSNGHRWHNVDCLTPLPFICMIGESLYKYCPPEVRRGEYCYYNTSLLSRYENYCINMNITIA